MAKKSPKVLLVENDEKSLAKFRKSLEDGTGLEIVTAQNVSEAIDVATLHNRTLSAAVIDLHLPIGGKADALRGFDEFPTGYALASKLHRDMPRLRIFGFSNEPAVTECSTFFRSVGDPDRTIGVYSKRYEWVLLRHHVNLHCGQPSRVKVFIVHGHDPDTLKELQEFAVGLGWDVTVLGEAQRQHQTWIEMFEREASPASLAWVLFTHDEWACPLKQGADPERRPRPNVILEYGYFLGSMGRRSRRVFLFCKGNVDLPSDIAGLAHTRLRSSVRDAEGDIRRELRPWL